MKSDLEQSRKLKLCRKILEGCSQVASAQVEIQMVLNQLEDGGKLAFDSNNLIVPDWEEAVLELIQAALDLRSEGKLPFYLSICIAAAFTCSEIDDAYLKTISDFSAEVGIKYALKCYTPLDREVDLIQLIYEQAEVIKQGHLLIRSIDKVQMICDTYEAAYQAEVKYHGCSQCVLIGLSETFRLVDPVLFKAATALSGGMAQCGDGACGGYSGGILYMGTFFGRSWELKDGDKVNQYKSFDMAQRLHDKYVETYGNVTGKAVHEKVFGEFFLLRDQKAKAAFGKMRAHEEICPCVVGSAARWVAEILIDENLY